jgi:hypothetical protein
MPGGGLKSALVRCGCELSYLDLELGIGMVMTPVPIVLPISIPKSIEVLIFSMAFLNPHAVGLVLAVIPLVIVIVSGVMITTSLLPMIVVSGLGGRGHSKWSD